MKRVEVGGLAPKPSNNMQGKKSSTSGGRVLIKELNDNDVLQGRGSGSMQNTGNIRFRSLVEKLRPAYVATSSRKEKAKMISDMVQLIQSRKGRFLQRLCDKEVEELGLDAQSGEHHRDQEHYVEMTDDEAAEKAKQAIRYVHYKKVPLEEERRKKRAADDDFLTGNDKTSGDANHRMDYGGNSLTSAPLSNSITNQMAQSHVPQSNVRAGVAIPPQLQQPDLSQLLASFQTTQNALAGQLPGNIYAAAQTPVAQTSVQRDAVQQAALMQQVLGGIIPMTDSVQHQPNTLQRLASSLLANNTSTVPQEFSPAPSTILDNSSSQNANQQQLSQQQTQLNVLLQSLLQQQTSPQPNSILQTILQQQQLNSALQTLQQQQQLASAIQSLQQPQQLGAGPQLQHHLQQQKANTILASLLSNANTNPQAGSILGPLTTQPAPAKSQSVTEATNALLTSFLSSNVPQTSAFPQTGNSHVQGAGKSGQLLAGLRPPMNVNGTKAVGNNTGQVPQQNQGLLDGSALQAIPGLAQNVNTLLAANGNANGNNSTQGQAIVTTKDSNASKRPRLSSDNGTNHPG